MAEVTGGERLASHLAEMAEKIGTATAVKVGFLEDAIYPDGTSVATVAALNNFGAPGAGLPARSFFSEMVARNSPEWGERFAEVLKAANYDVATALELMGDVIAGQLREAIIAAPGPANSPVTDLLKQRFPMREGMAFTDVLQARRDVADGKTAPPGKPLSWTGHMLASVDREVE